MAINAEEQVSEEISAPYSALSQAQKQHRLKDLAAVFFMIGVVDFGWTAESV